MHTQNRYFGSVCFTQKKYANINCIAFYDYSKKDQPLSIYRFVKFLIEMKMSVHIFNILVNKTNSKYIKNVRLFLSQLNVSTHNVNQEKDGSENNKY